MFNRYTNKYARWVRALAKTAAIMGTIIGFLLLLDDSYFLQAWSTIFSSILGMVLLLGFAEIIECVYRMYQRTETRILKDKRLSAQSEVEIDIS
ncbi:hypothetical protein [Brevibacillus nitrificans]|uniref:hypothetical protein n=1 Tax=Brevibacillus nitrificans TaxID=651560 RepID=UPI00285F6447|nr:hypothetical protein [Brevibacillus nitrificans]MDR7316228.1 putative ion transporter superfamily protein YfcC [Brevibacillus nitrificans]